MIANALKNKRAKELIIFIALLAALTILVVVGIRKTPPAKTTDRADTGGANITSALDALDAAKKIALGWHADVVLSTISSKAVADTSEPIDHWRFIFIAPSAPAKGFVVNVSTAKVTSAEEINYTGTGAPVPDNIISQGEAIRRVHQIHGYESQPVLGIEAVYDSVKKTWFWAAKTPIGTVSIEADR